VTIGGTPATGDAVAARDVRAAVYDGLRPAKGC
jgi:hypothetical protein